jgi:hypothetical protein
MFFYGKAKKVGQVMNGAWIPPDVWYSGQRVQSWFHQAR